MLWKIVALASLPLSLLAQSALECESMLHQADQIAKKFLLETAKSPPPNPIPQTQNCLDTASIWFTIDLNEICVPDGQSVFESLSSDELWSHLQEIGVRAVHLKGLKKGGAFRTGLAIDPRWGTECEWKQTALAIQKKGIVLLGDSFGSSTGLTSDFFLALKNYGDYPGLYHLIEIEKKDWKDLPQVQVGQISANVPWLMLQDLHKKGYVPEAFAPYIKESEWNATPQVSGSDGKMRRWIYLKENKNDPVLDWLNPSFAGIRIAAADALDSIFNQGEKILNFDSKIGRNAKETLSLWIRKLGAFTVQEVDGGIAAMKQVSADLAVDSLTRPALIHALIAEDAEALRLIYRIFLAEGIEAKRLVHQLQPFDRFACDWAEFICSPRKKFRYHEEQLTGEELRNRLLKEDLARLNAIYTDRLPLCTWTGICASALGIKDFEKHQREIEEAHLLLAFFYTMQPGVFSFSVSDLLGALPFQKPNLNLTGPNKMALYSPLPCQLLDPSSFASRLKQMFAARRDRQLESAELVDVPQTSNRSTLLLIHRLRGSGFTHILAINFGRLPAKETLESPSFCQSTAINLLNGLAEDKPLDSPLLTICLPPLTAKSIFIQPKYYD